MFEKIAGSDIFLSIAISAKLDGNLVCVFTHHKAQLSFHLFLKNVQPPVSIFQSIKIYSTTQKNTKHELATGLAHSIFSVKIES